jgi:cytoskeletal protein CcmA (bactofilin family)
MDPTEIQQDKSNNAHSLEEGGGGSGSTAPAEATVTKSDDGKTQTLDASGGDSPDDPPSKPEKESFISKFWHRFNIYLVLFILVVVLAVGIVVLLTVKSKQQANTATISSQSLSQNALQQLANTDVTVGDAKQILTVQSNAVFAGSVLVKSNLEVAGSLKVGSELSLTSLKVSGSSQLSDTSVNNLTVSGTLNLQGALTIKNGINVSGNSNFTGNVTTTSLTTGQLQINGDLNLTHHITAGGTSPSASRGTAVGGGGTISLSGSDTAGSIQINTGASPPAGCFVSVTFSQKFSSTPHVVVTPIGSGAAELTYYVDRTSTGFSICTTNSAPSGQTLGFDYIALD